LNQNTSRINASQGSLLALKVSATALTPAGYDIHNATAAIQRSSVAVAGKAG
jgi:hypothetical protein